MADLDHQRKDEDEREDSPKCNAQAEYAKTPIFVSIVSQVEPTPLADGVSSVPKHDDTPVWKRRLEHAAILLAVLVLFVYAGQLYVMNKQLGEMGDSGAQTDRLIRLYRMQVSQMSKLAIETHDLAVSANEQAHSTKNLAHQALIQAQASKASAEVSKAAFEAESRPYVSVTQIGVGFDTKRQSFDFAPIIVNSGRTTAKNVSYKMHSTLSIVDASITSNSSALINLQPGQPHTYLEKIDNSKDYARLVADGAYRFVVRINLHYEWRNNQESSCTDWEYDPTVKMFIDEGTVVSDPRNLCPKKP